MKAKKLIKQKLEELEEASKAQYQSDYYYNRIEAKILILEDILSELEANKPMKVVQCQDHCCKNDAVREYKGIHVCGGHYAELKNLY